MTTLDSVRLSYSSPYTRSDGVLNSLPLSLVTDGWFLCIRLSPEVIFALTIIPRAVYTQNLWSFLDVGFVGLYIAYLFLRIYGWSTGDPEPGEQALDVMAIAAPVVIPRLAFNLLSDSMVFLSLRAMMGDFAVLTALSTWCFAGFLISLQWLSPGSHDPV